MNPQRCTTRRLVLPLGMAILLFASSVPAQTPTRVLTAIVLKATNQSLKVLTSDRQAVTFVVARDAKVIGKGRAMLLPPAGRRWRLADALSQGDQVRIVYREEGDRKLAIDIRRLEER